MTDQRRFSPAAIVREMREASDDKVLTLYGKRGSGSAAVEAALVIAAVSYRIVETASWERNDAFEALLKINPLGQIPTLLLADGSVLSESAAILIHLGLTHPDSGLLPRDAFARAQALRGLVFIAANCYAAISVFDFPERWCAGADRDDAIKDRIRAGARARLYRHWEIFADLFPARPWLGGKQLGALDLYAAVVSKWSGARKHLEQKRPTLFAALQRVDAQPKVAAVFAQHWPAPKQ
jgi:GST-like protein